MKQSFQSIETYEFFLYTLTENFPSIKHSNISLIRRGASLARVSGEIHFDHKYRLVVRERLLFHCSPIVLDWYGYEIWQGEELLCRYDCQPHPDDPFLETSYPHHKHILPNLNRNRAPAPNMSFTQPNLPEIIREIMSLIEALEKTIKEHHF
jgi:hypothetical protein